MGLFKVTHIIGDLVNTAADMAQMLKNEIALPSSHDIASHHVV